MDFSIEEKHFHEEPRSKLLGIFVGLERKFIVMAGSIPRSEDLVTTFLGVVNFPEQAPEYGPGLPINFQGASAAAQTRREGYAQISKQNPLF
ncbi:MAG: hypothetical protein LBP20_06620 [Treponema sp.]|nr:hypothetical protein [Treponema sp.]